MRHDFKTLSEVFEHSTRYYARRPAYEVSGEDGRISFADFAVRCRRVSDTLSCFGISAGDKVAILSQNMPGWAVAFFAVTAFGRVGVPMLTELSENEIRNILTHSGTRALFVSERLLGRIPEDLLASMRVVIRTDDLGVIRTGEAAYTHDGETSVPGPDDLACIIYTSGTTGAAKGVMLSHRNFCANILESWHAQHVGRRDVFLSILPLAHTYELSIGMLYPFAVGAKVCYLNRPPTPSVLIPALKAVRPTNMLSVPLVIEKIYKSSILPTIRGSRFLSTLEKAWPWLLHQLVGMKLKKTFGGRIRFFGIGGAKLDGEVETFLKKARFPYAIGYGLTETAPLICNANPRQTRVGTTGVAAYGVTVRLDNCNPETGEGEIVVKGPNVMKGYYKDYERTREVLSPDGWFRTGDLASVDDKGRYSIKGRLGNLIVGPSGENIYPEEIESVINNIEGVSESLVVSRGGHLVAMVHFDDNVLDWNYENEDRFIEELERRKKEILDFVNTQVGKVSRIKDVEIAKLPFAKTATLKIRRFLYKEKEKPSRG